MKIFFIFFYSAILKAIKYSFDFNISRFYIDFYTLIKDFGSLIGILVTLVSMLAISYKLGGRLSKINLELENLKEDNKKLDIKVDNLGTKVDNLDKRVLTLKSWD